MDAATLVRTKKETVIILIEDGIRRSEFDDILGTGTVCFDLVGTLIPVSDWQEVADVQLQQTLHLLSADLGLDMSEAGILLRNRDELLSKIQGRTPTMLETIVSLKIQKKTYFDLINNTNPAKYLRANPQLANMVSKLRINHQLGIITTATQDIALAALKAYGFRSNWFGCIVCGDDVKNTKPSLEPFELFLKRSKNKAQDVAYAGDRKEIDLSPAKFLGMRAVLISKKEDDSYPRAGSMQEFLTDFMAERSVSS